MTLATMESSRDHFLPVALVAALSMVFDRTWVVAPTIKILSTDAALLSSRA